MVPPICTDVVALSQARMPVKKKNVAVRFLSRSYARLESGATAAIDQGVRPAVAFLRCSCTIAIVPSVSVFTRCPHPSQHLLSEMAQSLVRKTWQRKAPKDNQKGLDGWERNAAYAGHMLRRACRGRWCARTPRRPWQRWAWWPYWWFSSRCGWCEAAVAEPCGGTLLQLRGVDRQPGTGGGVTVWLRRTKQNRPAPLHR